MTDTPWRSLHRDTFCANWHTISSVPGRCARLPKARGWCATHYARWRRTGDPIQVRLAGRPKQATNARVDQLFAEWSPRTRARYHRARRITAAAKAYGYEIDERRAHATATRPNGSLNVSL